MCKIVLESGPHSTYRIVPLFANGKRLTYKDHDDNGKKVRRKVPSILIQTDWEHPSIASTFGWSIRDVQCNTRCDHRHTDGTVDCPDCGLSAGEFISAAAEWLDDNIGETADDPGYFQGE